MGPSFATHGERGGKWATLARLEHWTLRKKDTFLTCFASETLNCLSLSQLPIEVSSATSDCRAGRQAHIDGKLHRVRVSPGIFHRSPPVEAYQNANGARQIAEVSYLERDW